MPLSLGALLVLSACVNGEPLNQPAKPDVVAAREVLQTYADAITRYDTSTVSQLLCASVDPESLIALFGEVGPDGRATISELLRSATLDEEHSTLDAHTFVVAASPDGTTIEHTIIVRRVELSYCVEETE